MKKNSDWVTAVISPVHYENGENKSSTYLITYFRNFSYSQHYKPEVSKQSVKCSTEGEENFSYEIYLKQTL